MLADFVLASGDDFYTNQDPEPDLCVQITSWP